MRRTKASADTPAPAFIIKVCDKPIVRFRYPKEAEPGKKDNQIEMHERRLAPQCIAVLGAPGDPAYVWTGNSPDWVASVGGGVGEATVARR